MAGKDDEDSDAAATAADDDDGNSDTFIILIAHHLPSLPSKSTQVLILIGVLKRVCVLLLQQHFGRGVWGLEAGHNDMARRK